MKTRSSEEYQSTAMRICIPNSEPLEGVQDIRTYFSTSSSTIPDVVTIVINGFDMDIA